jgi:hypothetical protein
MIRTRIRDAMRSIGAILRTQLRTIIPVGIVVLVGTVVIAILAGAYAQLIGATAYQSLVTSVRTVGTYTLAVIAILIPLLLLALLASLVWAGTAVQAANAAMDGRPASMVSAVWGAFKRSPRALAVILITLGAAVAAIIGAPLLIVVGVVGLLLRRRGAAKTDTARWLSREALIVMAIPFGVAVLVLVRWALALPAVWLRGLAPREALRDSSERVRGRGPEVAVVFILALAVSFGLGLAAAAIVDPFWHTAYSDLVIQLIALILFGALPFTALAVLYRRDGAEPSERLASPATRRARIAAATVATLLIPFMIGVSSAPASASPETVTVTADSTQTVVGEELTLTAQVTGNSPTGNVTFDAVPQTGPDVIIGTQAIDGTGTSVIQDYWLPKGVYGIVVQYAGDANNAPASSAPLAHTVIFASTTMTVTANPPATAGPTTLTVTVAGVAPAFEPPSGTVTVSGGGNTLDPVTLDGTGVATVPIDVTTLGARDLTISYSGDSEYATNSTDFSVPKIPTTMDVFGPTARAATYGDSETFAGSVTSSDGTTPTGTVELIWYNNAVVATGQLDDTGDFSITTNLLRASSQHIFLLYTGDSTHATSDNSAPADLISLEVDQAVSVPVVSVTPGNPAIGDTTTLTATLDNIGAGPTGTVTFTDADNNLLGTAPVSDGTASIEFTPTELTTFITASYSGDINFEPEASAPFRQDATQAVADVAIVDPGTLTYGQVFDLTANVQVGGGAIKPDHGVDFTVTGGAVIASDVPVIAGQATVSVCAGEAADCPVGVPALGASETNITASYAASSTNLLGQSAPYDYDVGKATTTTTLSVNPTNVVFGSAVFLSATVAVPGSGVTPTGHVTFYGVVPVDGGGTALSFLGNGDLVGGVAQLDTASGNQLDQLIWPADAVEAIYDADGANFKASNDSVPITLGRVGVTVGVSATGEPAGTPTPVTVTLTEAGGASADYTGEITVTADTGASCNAFPASGQRVVSCDITWTTVGDHTVSATYSGDVVYLPGTSPTITVSAGKANPALGASVAGTAVVGNNVTVSWNQFDPAASGTVTVWGDGTQWCSVSVLALSCTGQFGASSATGSPVDVVVQYSGDSNWNGVQQTLGVLVSACATLDVRSLNTALGTVRVNTAPNCGGTGYAAGTTVSVTATPVTPAVFVHWLAYRSGALETSSTSATTSFVVTNDSLTWVHEAVFATPCDSVTASATGYGGLFITPATNCTTDGGDPGYLYGTKVAIYPDGHYDPTYGEDDAFRAFGALPAGASVTHDSSGRVYLALTVTTPTVIPLSFGPVCRPVTIVFDPASSGDSVNFSTPQNCFSPFGNGYLNGTTVTASVLPGDPTLAISGWSENGVPAPSLGTTNTPTAVVDTTAPVLTATLVHCYTVDITVDGATDTKDNQIGDVRVDGPPNCPDGSSRYLAGTQVTLTPEILVNGAKFNGWDDNLVGAVAPAGGTGDVTQYIRTITMTSDITTTAGFYLDSACSRLTIVGDPSLLTFDSTGCGPGYYADLQKQVATSTGVDPSTLWQQKYHTDVHVDVNRTQKLDVYASVKSDVRGCFGSVPSTSGPSTAGNQWQSFGPLTGASSDCNIAGDTAIWLQACQTVVTTPVFTVQGDTSGRTYDESSLPGTFYLSDSSGVIHGYTMTGFEWAQPVPIDIANSGTVTQTDIPPGPCHDSGKAFPSDTDLALVASGPSDGFLFDGWSGANVNGLFPFNPLSEETTDTQRTLENTANYTVVCHTVTLGEGLSVAGDAPRCPGTSDSDNSYIAGTAIQVQAVPSIGNRNFDKFSSGVVAGQIYDGGSAKQGFTAFAVVDGDKTVTASYLTNAQFTGLGIEQGLKFTAGIMAVAAPIALGALFPPAGILFAVLGAGAGIADLIPGGGTAASVFNLLNPTSITTCAARWAFTNSGNPTGGDNVGSILSTANTVRKVANGADVITAPIGPVGAAGGLASLGMGLYSAGIGNTDFSPQTVEQLNGTSTMTNCLDDQWSAAGANVSGLTGAPAATTGQ